MFTPQNVHYKNTKRMSILIIIFDAVLFFLLLTLEILSSEFKKLDEVIPEDIYITGIKSFTFTYNSEQIQYIKNIPNLGNTSLIDFDCYKGYCRKQHKYSYYYSHINNNSLLIIIFYFQK